MDQYGDILVTGAVRYGDAQLGYATLKYSGSGLSLWTNLYSGPGNYADLPVGIVVDGGGTAYVTGTSYGSGTGFDYATVAYSASGIPVWTNRYDGPVNGWDVARGIALGGGGDILVTGEAEILAGAPPVYATIAYSNLGIPLWTNTYPSDGQGTPAGVAADSSGNVFVTGSSQRRGEIENYATVEYLERRNSNLDEPCGWRF